MVAALDQIREGEAPAELAGLYLDIRKALRTPYVPFLFSALATHHGALRAVWRQLRPNVVTRAFEEEADDLRAELARGAVDLGTPLIEPVLAGEGFDVDELDDLRGLVQLFQYVDPKVLLCVAALAPQLEGHRVGGRERPLEMLAKLPDPPAEEIPPLALVAESPGGVMGEIFKEILKTTHLPFVPVDLRALGHTPRFLETAWLEIAPIFQHRALAGVLEALSQSAEKHTRQLPYAMALSAEDFETPAAFAHTERVVGILRDALPRLALFASALRVSLDGPQDALDSPYPVEWETTSPESLGI